MVETYVDQCMTSSRWNIDKVVMRPDWRLGARGGPERNKAMVNYVLENTQGWHTCLAFLKPGYANKGTLGCMGLALQAGIIVEPVVLDL